MAWRGSVKLCPHLCGSPAYVMLSLISCGQKLHGNRVAGSAPGAPHAAGHGTHGGAVGTDPLSTDAIAEARELTFHPGTQDTGRTAPGFLSPAPAWWGPGGCVDGWRACWESTN